MRRRTSERAGKIGAKTTKATTKGAQIKVREDPNIGGQKGLRSRYSHNKILLKLNREKSKFISVADSPFKGRASTKYKC